jgi:soluble lytic murein transglycosylase
VLGSGLRHACLALVLLLAMGGGASAALSPEDRQAYRDAFAAARANAWPLAHQSAAQAQERLPAKILLWLELTRRPDASFADIVDFADHNPDWPGLAALRQRAEERSTEISDAVLLPYFRKHPPATTEAKLRLVAMEASAGDAEAAARLLRETWVAADLDPATEQQLLGQYGAMLAAPDHIARLDRLLWDGQQAAAQRQLARVPENWRRLGEARLALMRQQPDAETLIDAVPAELRQDPGLLLDHARWLRRRDALEAAAAILLDPPAKLERPAAWWAERQFLTRRLLDEKADASAYRVIARHGLAEGGADFADGEFLAGWIALRRLDDASAAAEHFKRLYANVKLPVSLARGAYWAGRAAERLGQDDEAKRWLASAAKHGASYYGQLAASRLGVRVTPEFPPEPAPAESASFDGNELTRAARMLGEIGEASTAKPFLLRLSAVAKTPGEQELVIRLAREVGRLDVALTAARHATADGVPALEPGFPLIPVAQRGAAEPPLVLAITRQESVFDPEAVSRSDARGLMQLKPSTAQDMAKALSIPFAAGRLLSDPAYNVTLGQAYLDKLLGRFGGSYVLAVAAYNAGPNRVQQWLDAYGDPRQADADVVDWIETIPFNETRNYVQRVLENLQVYRLRLGDSTRAFTLADDLKR